MERLKLFRFLRRAASDKLLLASHISLYAALFSLWEQSQFSPSFRVTRKELMHLSKLASTATYHKCLKELVSLGYLEYEPSYNHFKGSTVRLIQGL